MTEPLPPDQLEGAPHPREAARLFGHAAAEARFVEAFAAGRLHHAWLISGPRGIGKATLAWKLAAFLIATPDPGGDGPGLFGEGPQAAPDGLDLPEDHPVQRRLRAGSEPGLFHILRSRNDKTGKWRDVITAEEVRRLNGFLSLSATDGGRRVVLIDSADDMNVQAANALLKMLEEPPARTVFLLVCHQPARLLPTIRSRCRDLRLGPLDAAALGAALEQAGFAPGDQLPALAALTGGSAGAAISLMAHDGLRIYGALVDLFAGLPRLDRAAALALAEKMAGAGEASQQLFTRLMNLLLVRLARHGATGAAPAAEVVPGEAALLARLCPDLVTARSWAEAAQEIELRLQTGQGVNLDPAVLLIDTFARVQKIAASNNGPTARP